MIVNYIKIAWRNLKRNGTYSFININGLTVGLAAFILIFLWVNDELSYDTFNKNFDNIYRIIYHSRTSGQNMDSASPPLPLGQALQEKYPEIIKSSRIGTFVGEVLIKYRDTAFYERGGRYVDEEFFDIFSLPIIRGDRDNIFPDMFSVVLTESMAEKYYPGIDPIGETLVLENVCGLRVTGITSDPPANSHIQFDFLVRYDLYSAWGVDMQDWSHPGDNTYILVSEAADRAVLENKIKNHMASVNSETKDFVSLQPLSDVYLNAGYAYDGTTVKGDYTYVYLFSIIGAIILILACINFVLLATAQASKRYREIGMRKVAGATKLQLIRQFLMETLFLVLVGFIISLFIIELVLPYFNNFTGKSLALNITSGPVVLYLFILVVATGLLAGLYPALLMSGYKPVNILKGVMGNTGNSGNMLRKVLVVSQFVISIALIVCTLFVYNQLHYMKSKELGMQTEAIICVQHRPGLYGNYYRFKEELLSEPGILSVTATGISRQPYVQKDIKWDGWNPDNQSSIYRLDVDKSFLDVMGISLLEGRNFSEELESDNSNFIINRQAAAIIADGQPLGAELQISGIKGNIIGICEDFHANSLHSRIEPLILTINPGVFVYSYIRIDNNNMKKALTSIEETWNKLVPEFPFVYEFLDNEIENFYVFENKLAGLFLFFAGLAIFISCLGLFGLSAFLAERSRKEIGIRKTFGASVGHILVLLSGKYLKWVVLANIIAWPLSYLAVSKWLDNYAYRIDVDIMPFAAAFMIAILIAALTVVYQALRAAIASPVNSLKYE